MRDALSEHRILKQIAYKFFWVELSTLVILQETKAGGKREKRFYTIISINIILPILFKLVIILIKKGK